MKLPNTGVIFVMIPILFSSFNISYAQNPDNKQSVLNPGLFDTKAEFTIDGTIRSLSSAVATIETHPAHGPEYLWLEINFYPFTLTDEEIADASNGSLELIKKRRYQEDGNPQALAIYNSQARIVLGMDTNYKIFQVDMSVPGHSCTIAPFEEDVKNFLKEYSFEGEHLRLKSKGSYLCDIPPEEIPDWTFGLNIDLHIPVFKKMSDK
mgnify:CR=1 FL=1